MLDLEIMIPDLDARFNTNAPEDMSALELKKSIIGYLGEDIGARPEGITLIDAESMEVIGEEITLGDAGLTNGTRLLFICE